jgi:hypothetical protein
MRPSHVDPAAMSRVCQEKNKKNKQKIRINKTRTLTTMLTTLM